LGSLRPRDFAVLDKLLILEAGVRKTPALTTRLREALLSQIVAIKNDVRIISTLLTADFPSRTAAIVLREWAGSNPKRPTGTSKR
jgi:hypothetical protein